MKYSQKIHYNIQFYLDWVIFLSLKECITLIGWRIHMDMDMDNNI